MALGGAQVTGRACLAGPAPAASARVRIFSLSGGPRMTTLMLTRQEADGHERLLMAVKYRSPDRTAWPLTITYLSPGLEVPDFDKLRPGGHRGTGIGI